MSQDETAVDAERQHTVLVVEDDRAIREMIEFWLQEHAIQVITAQDGAEAIAIIDAQPAPLCCVLLDIMLPRHSGLDVLRDLRGRGHTTAVIAMSADRQALADAIHAGAAVAIAKPFDVQDLISMVVQHCSGQHP
jgi:DNA-binding response OmpR family regulator